MKTISAIIFLLAIFLTNPLAAQQIEGTQSTAKKKATVHIASIPQVSSQPGRGIKVPNPGWQPPEWSFAKEKVIYRQAESNTKVSAPTKRISSPIADTTFSGLMDDGTSIPPDVNGAAGPSHLMQTLNTDVRISDREGNELYTTTLSAWWAPIPGPGSTFDPKIVYDPYSNRWIMITPSGSDATSSQMYIGVSTTDDPLDDWNFYAIDTDPDHILWFDYPNLGFNKKWITIGGIMRNSSFEAVEFVVYAMDKMAAYAGDETPVFSRFTTTIGSAIVPSFTYDSLSEDMYLISTGDGNDGGYGYVNLFKLSGDVDDPLFELKGSIGVPEPCENWSYENHGDPLPQAGSSQKLNSVDARMHTMIYRNDKLWAVHHIYLPADNPLRCAIQWWELDTAGVILERGRIEDTTNLTSFAFPSIAVNAHEDIFIGHGVFSPDAYASAGYSFKDHMDDSGSMRDYYLYKDGQAPYYKTFGGDRNRWGDYSAVFVDPVHDVDFWAMHEFADSTLGTNKWGTWWAFMMPSFVPEANFTSDEILIPLGETVNFTDLSLGVPGTWEWTFEGGTPDTSTEQNPSNILFDQEGSFDIKLIAGNSLGTDTIIKEDYITTSTTILPEVDFTVSIAVVCTDQEVVFTDRTKYSPNQWEWQFDPSNVTFVNGTDESSQNPEVIFNEARPYTVSLKAWNLNGSSELTKFDMITAGGYGLWFTETFEPDSFKSEEWIFENPDESMSWELLEVAGSEPGVTAMGLKFHEYLFGIRNRLITPPFNLTGTSGPVLDFQHAYAKKYAPITDSLIVYVSPDCGENWTRVFADGEDGSGNFATRELTENFWPETQDDWCGYGWGANCISIGLENWMGQDNVRIAFETYSAIGNPLFIDNMMLTTVYGTDENPDESTELKIFPNPTNGAFTIALPKKGNYTTLEVFSPMGVVVYRQELKGVRGIVEVNLNKKLASGIFLIKVSSNGKFNVGRVILQ